MSLTRLGLKSLSAHAHSQALQAIAGIRFNGGGSLFQILEVETGIDDKQNHQILCVPFPEGLIDAQVLQSVFTENRKKHSVNYKIRSHPFAV